MSSIVGEDLGYDSEEDARRDDALDDLEDLGQPDRAEVFMPAVQNLVNALGGFEQVETPAGSGEYETIYRPGDSVLGVLKDLKKLWRKDDSDDERTVARCMAKAGLMKELIALLVECTDRGDWGRKVALMACDLIAALTWPIDVQQELKEIEDERELVTDYATLLRAQIQYKAMILHTNGPLRCILALMLPNLAKARKDEKDEKIISLGLHIIRNLLAIKDAVAEGTATGEKEELANLQSTMVVQLDQLTYFRLLLTLASCADKTEYNLYNVLVLDILHLVFRSVKARELAQDQDRAPIENLTKLLEAEKRQKSQQSRSGMTRHSRFGTTVAVRAGDQRLVLHKQNAITVDAGKMLDEVKRKRAGRVLKVDDLSRTVNLSPEAMRALQTLAKTFIQSSFNTFFASILKDIRMERSKIRLTDNVRCFVLARFFIDYLLVLRQKAAANNGGEVIERDDLSFGLVAEMAELESVRWVFMRMRYTIEEKPPAWTELQACIDCFTQILLLLDAMAASKEEEDVEVANILQDQLYYNGDILDSCLQVISHYKDQSVAYLDSVVHFAYVLLRMLEKYSKNKTFMFIRKKKANRRKKKAKAAGKDTESAIPEDYHGDSEEDDNGEMPPDRNAPTYAEHAFTFQSFEKRFACESVVKTLMSYLSRFREFEDPEQMKRVVGLMHRQVVKTQAEGLYFKVSSLTLFRQVLDEQNALPKGDATKDLLQLVNFTLRKFFKRVSEDPFLIVQAFSPKTRSSWKEISSYKSDDDSDDGMGGQRDRIREKLDLAPPELEFKKNKKLSWSKQMEVAIGLLLKADHKDWIEWILEFLEIALASRTEIVLTTDGSNVASTGDDDDEDRDEETRRRNFAGPSREAMDKFQQIDLDPEYNVERKMALARDQHFRLMLKLLAFDRTEDVKALDQKWFLPAMTLPANLTASIGALQQYLASPPDPEADTNGLLRRARRPRRVVAHDSDSDLEGYGTKQKEKRVRKRKTAETQIYKSAAFIEDSDDDEEADKAFFEKEKQLRLEMQAMAEAGGNTMRAGGGTKKRKRKGKGKEGDDAGGESVNGGASSQVEPSQMDVDVDLDPSSPVKTISQAVVESESESDNEPDPRQKTRSVSPSSVAEPRPSMARRRIVDSDSE